MKQFIISAIKIHGVLPNDKRNLFSLAYKNIVYNDSRKMRYVYSVEAKYQNKNFPYMPLIKNYKKKMNKKIYQDCLDFT